MLKLHRRVYNKPYHCRISLPDFYSPRIHNQSYPQMPKHYNMTHLYLVPVFIIPNNNGTNPDKYGII